MGLGYVEMLNVVVVLGKGTMLRTFTRSPTESKRNEVLETVMRFKACVYYI